MEEAFSVQGQVTTQFRDIVNNEKKKEKKKGILVIG